MYKVLKMTQASINNQYLHNILLYLFFFKKFYSDNGISSNLLKVGIKRRRTKHEIESDKVEAELKEAEN